MERSLTQLINTTHPVDVSRLTPEEQSLFTGWTYTITDLHEETSTGRISYLLNVGERATVLTGDMQLFPASYLPTNVQFSTIVLAQLANDVAHAMKRYPTT